MAEGSALLNTPKRKATAQTPEASPEEKHKHKRPTPTLASTKPRKSNAPAPIVRSRSRSKVIHGTSSTTTMTTTTSNPIVDSVAPKTVSSKNKEVIEKAKTLAPLSNRERPPDGVSNSQHTCVLT